MIKQRRRRKIMTQCQHMTKLCRQILEELIKKLDTCQRRFKKFIFQRFLTSSLLRTILRKPILNYKPYWGLLKWKRFPLTWMIDQLSFLCVMADHSPSNADLLWESHAGISTGWPAGRNTTEENNWNVIKICDVNWSHYSQIIRNATSYSRC